MAVETSWFWGYFFGSVLALHVVVGIVFWGDYLFCCCSELLGYLRGKCLKFGYLFSVFVA